MTENLVGHGKVIRRPDSKLRERLLPGSSELFDIFGLNDIAMARLLVESHLS